MNWKRRLDEVDAYFQRINLLGPEKLRAGLLLGLGLGSLEDWEIMEHDELEDTRLRRLEKALFLRKTRLLGTERGALRDYADAADEIASYLPDETVPQRYFDALQQGLDHPALAARLTVGRVLAEQGGLEGIPMRRRFAGTFREWLADTAAIGEPRHLCALRDQLRASGYEVVNYD